jgi:tRNA1Val (adenine37-N6)-methyltransferase
MSNTYFQFKQFTIHQDKTAMKVTTDACLFGAWVAEKNIPVPAAILDIGTGTGLLSLMLAQKLPDARITAIEIEQNAVEQAQSNAGSTPWYNQINIIHADAKEHAFDKKFDIIISNPPFYEKELKGPDAGKNKAHHDESLMIPDLLRLIKKNLADDGKFFILMPFKRYEELRTLLTEQELNIDEIVLVRQSKSHDFFRIMLKGSLPGNEFVETNFSEISIKDGENYTAEFVSLLKEYYLNL